MNVSEIIESKGSEVVTVAPDLPVAKAVELLAEHGIGALVVSADGTQIGGVLSERDLVLRFAAEGVETAHALVSEVMTVDVVTCSVEDRIEALMAKMTDRRIRHLPVIDEDGALCGIISIGDVVKARLDDLELEKDQLVEYVRGGR